MSTDQSDDGGGYGVVHRSLRGHLTAYELAAVVALSWRVDGTQTCWIRHQRLADEAGMSVSKLKAVLLRLRELGLVSWVPKVNDDGAVVCNIYTLHRTSMGSPPQGGGVATSEPPPSRDTATEREPLNETPGTTDHAASGAGEPVTLFAVPDPEPDHDDGPPKTAQTLVARWCDGYRDANSGADAPKAFMGRVAGQAKALAKACGPDHEEWVLAWNASYSAGQAGHADMTRHLVRTSRPATGRRNVFADPSLGGPTSDTMARLTAHLATPTRPELETPR